jgi:hypothetical protein
VQQVPLVILVVLPAVPVYLHPLQEPLYFAAAGAAEVTIALERRVLVALAAVVREAQDRDQLARSQVVRVRLTPEAVVVARVP